MSKRTSHRHPPGTEPQPLGAWTLRFAFLGGAVAWLLHLLLAYVVAEFGCLAGLGNVATAGLTPVAWLLLAVSLPTVAMAVAATIVAWRSRHRLPAADEVNEGSGSAEGFTVRTGLSMNALFTFVIAIQSIPIFYFLSGC